MLMMMIRTINKTQRLILLASLVISLCITVVMLLQDKPAQLQYNCFQTAGGWGYNILVNDKIIIHQPAIPGIAGNKSFTTQQQAQDVAQIVIEKIKSGHQPIITRDVLQQLNIISAQ